ncbi:MAG: hypothetical protein HFJ10_02655 [Lachnospiraceae bacterium]|nr:hypothetical protein [Lachnospiraceae bacterium]
MSTLEKTIGLLEALPDNKIETVYAFVRFIGSQDYESTNESLSERQKKVQSMLGIAHEYADPALIEQEKEAFERAIVEKYAALCLILS